jgi:hypothetical protein
MSEDKGLGSKILGLFVEKDSRASPADADGGEKSPAELVAELAGQAGVPLGAPLPPGLKVEKMTGATTDFDTLFKDAGMDVAELERVKKAEDLLKTLPDSVPHETKKQIVESSLKAFGFEVEKIIAAAQNQKRALDAYVKVNEQATLKAISENEQQIKSLNEKIASLKADIEKRSTNLGALSTAATTRKGQVQKVLDFFQVPTPPPAA